MTRASGVSQSAVIAWRCSGSVNDAAVMTTSASLVASRGASTAVRGGDPRRRAGRVRKRVGPVADAGRGSSSSTPGRTWPSTSRWLWPCTPAPMMAARGARPASSGPNRASATPETAAVRCAVIGPPSRMARGTPVVGSLRITTAWMAGSPARPVLREPRDPLDAEQVGAGAGRAGRPASRGRTSPRGRGWTPIFGGSSASATSAVIVRSASSSRSPTGGIAAVTSAADR